MKIKKFIQRIQLFLLRKTFAPGELMEFVHRLNGIGNHDNEKGTGEEYVIEHVAAKRYHDKHPVIFDVGANIGNYSRLIKDIIPNATVYAFEPNKKAYAKLKIIADQYGIHSENIGFGEEHRTASLHSFSNVAYSELGTSNPEVLKALHGKNIDDTVEEIPFAMDTIDHYCQNRDITEIDFLKIDVEGYEKNVLLGARDMIGKHGIKLIQFEFNVMNLEYGIRLKDFYKLLPEYDFFRITKDGLIALGAYDTDNEIFQYQNILAIYND